MSGQRARAAPYRGAVCDRGDGRKVHALGLCRRCYEASRRVGLYVGRGVLSPELPEWMGRGLCAQPGADPDAWFPPADDPAAWQAAAAACGGCPVRAQCLAWALAFGELDHGVWGGTTPAERRRMTRARAA